MKSEFVNMAFHYAKDVSFVLALVLPMFLFGLLFEKRKKYGLRLGLMIAAFLLMILGLTFLDASEVMSETIEDALEYAILSWMTIVFLPLCYKTSVLRYVFADFCATNVAMIARSLRSILIYLIYQEDYKSLMSSHRLAYESSLYGLILLTCLLTYFVIIRRLKKYGEFYISMQSIALYIFSSIIHSVLNSAANMDMSGNASMWIMMNVCLVGFSILLVFMQLVIIDQGYKQAQIVLQNQMISNMKEQYRHSEEVTQALNIKYHDLKHVMNLLKKDSSQNYQEEIGSILNSYASIVETGNHTLDVILTEKSLSCQQNGIELTCDIDGRKLAFMNDYDLYSFFFNGLDNAIEYLKSIEEKENRFLILRQTSINGMLTLTIENYCKERLLLKNGLPVTTKGNDTYHGFGTKSMKETVEKYHGIFTISQEDDLFVVKAVFVERNADENCNH